MANRFTDTMRKKEAIEAGIPPDIVENIIEVESEFLAIERELEKTLSILANIVRHIDLETPLKGTETLFNAKTWLKNHKMKSISKRKSE